ncbi:MULTISPECIES: bifunctional 3-deoxy-7-phosphoheptulonate synthase/chorismate mutase [unclassified Ferrimonas]|uniref:bifunctional 3-deoxy-7-phosphoheptulonate synthase/chorismate mutase n=1 Tax=unclassified Ferrimonas TaxID=2620587 RepID=UPI002572621D|nr:bifunctional 3-deoxy-7-phosphoheptulonate synthase/chorismate mutase [Ferrimonas sp. YFM]BDY05928.1 3-deoxy-7-phosphoheptulonate synthase [Ferrimonas sp. YFM]
MIIILKPHASKEDAQQLLSQIEAKGLKPLYMPGVERTVLGALGDERVLQSLHLESHPLVDEVKPILSSYKLVSRELYPIDTRVKIGRHAVGGEGFTVIAGPCAVESQEQMDGIADYLTHHPVAAIRGGAYKPRTSPYSFQGLGEEGLKILKATSERSGLPTVSEVVDAADAELMAQYVDCLQIGARNMQNFRLLEAVGKLDTPVLLKRGMSATIEELLLAAEYIVNAGNPNVILCERGIRTYETATRNTLDLNAVAYLKRKTHLPVLVDPSHGTGIRELVIPLARAAAAVGADGIIVETHTNPAQALSDGHQNLDPQQFDDLMSSLKPFVEAAGRSLK